jgi:hypothetical protein
VLRRTFLLGLVALPACATRNVVFRRRSPFGLPRDAPLWVWPVESRETAYRDESLDALESYLVGMLARDGARVQSGGPPPEGWSLAIRVAGLPIRRSEEVLPSEAVLDATALVVVRRGDVVFDVVSVTEEVRTYYADRLPWRLARRIADVIAMRRRES